MTDTTVDQREVDFYTRMAATWWDRDGPFWPLHQLNELRTDYILERLCDHFGRDPKTDGPLEGLSLLDVGCGGGILAESMAKCGAQVTGIDVVEKNLRVASLHASQQSIDIDYRLMTASALADSGATFDAVLNMEVVEHVADLNAFMHDCCRLTSDDGVMFVATINKNLLSWLVAIVGAEYILRWLPRGTHRWAWFRTPQQLEEHLTKDGLSTADIVGVTANPFNRQLRMTQSTKVNYMLFAARP